MPGGSSPDAYLLNLLCEPVNLLISIERDIGIAVLLFSIRGNHGVAVTCIHHHYLLTCRCGEKICDVIPDVLATICPMLREVLRSEARLFHLGSFRGVHVGCFAASGLLAGALITTWFGCSRPHKQLQI